MPVNPRAANAPRISKIVRTMKPRPILITAAALALFASPLCAQDNAPEGPQGPAQREDGPRRPDADRPERPRDSNTRPPQEREGRFGRGGEGMRRPDGNQFQRPDSADGPPPQQGRPEGDFRREGPQGPPPQADRRERADGPEDDRRGGEQGPRFGQQGRGPGVDMRPPRTEERGGPAFGGPGDSRMGQRPDGMRRHQRRMMDNFGFAPRRGGPQDFRGGENEMRVPMPRPPQDPGFDRVGPERGPFPGRDRMDQRPPQGGPRPEFAPGNPGDQRFGPGPRRGFDGPRPQFGRPSPDFRGPPPPRREGPPRPAWDEERGAGF